MKDTLWKMGRKLFFLSSFCASFTPASCRSHQNQVVTLYTPHPCPAPSPPPTSHVLVPCSLITQSVWRKGLKKVWKKQLWSMHLKLASMAALIPHGSPTPEPVSWYNTPTVPQGAPASVSWYNTPTVPTSSPKPESWLRTEEDSIPHQLQHVAHNRISIMVHHTNCITLHRTRTNCTTQYTSTSIMVQGTINFR